MAKFYSSLSEIRSGLQRAEITVEGLVKNYLDQIKKNAHLNAFNEVFEQESLINAKNVDDRIKNGTAGKLAGMVIAIKDNICYKGHQVSASSKILKDFTSIYSSTIVERLLAEDAIIIGRCNCDEFAMGGANETSYFGPVKNMADETKVSGGSSGGSAVAVQANMCHAAIGTDTGGSVRQPASFCGVIGLKPTYGRVSRHGIIAFASSFDQVGPITRSVEDAALLLEVMAGPDDYDSTLAQQEVPAFSAHIEKTGKKKIAYLQEAISSPGVDAEVKDVLVKYIDKLRADGHTVTPIAFEQLDYLVPAYYILAMAEASSNLARYDGVHYGYRSPSADDLQSTYKRSRSEGFGKEVKRRIMLGTFVLSAGYYDAYYAKAQKVRRLIREKTDQILNEYDFILVPTAPEPAFAIGKEEKDPVVTYLSDIFTVQASLAGVPAISLPVGNNSKGLPLGLQLLAKHFNEQELLNFSKYFLEL
ncbi:Asp-tRNA(Asn)/Glu-tRNA(Gln) amidotransferase subunit GatA [Mucilaginibacter lappiensis]|uniref:Glutamyl-tRNA(Gln) amidotransferase subunit A n=1 Tax=Mucilaginibacter lappiensis TaxID=354630 RepID=A0A1N7DKJ9_9SPHI|nr:Asp-tRNA(Asn)/Glu-tRNA(Gln) amidotransferase subunit GatA [Mucilaginibacter lappiensis]MBB6111364.1 aspartyl-tRNA(Asn)/glutamyl-tRNA(Gln) amidotransferase subunit A [Mucilaginibacter lappiensis]MBB6129646.1 aspartyl-tRNA(Asn)/glutamyl-tRNA(Gln) amidotransferase subunit A [Mucilaginibacter lappiensis]SIR76265.1 aspartyl/glutamyl-tRNA(Asn/Gln) amidotransferase subunit A [Mucilaginibacter lappiensis]